MEAFRFLLSKMGNHRHKVYLGAVFILLSSFIFMAAAKEMGTFVSAIASENFSDLYYLAGGIIVLETCSLLFMHLGRVLFSRSALLGMLEIRKYLFTHLSKLPQSYFDQEPQGRITTRMTHDVEGIEDFLAQTAPRMIQGIISFLVALLAMLFTDVTTALIILVSLLPAIILSYTTRGTIRYFNRAVTRSSASLNALLSEYISGLPILRTYCALNWATKNFYEEVLENRKYNLASNSFYAWNRPLISLLCEIPLIAILYFGGMHTIAGTMSIATFVAFIRYGERITYPIAELAKEVHLIQQAFASTERLTTFMQAPVEDQVLGVAGSLPTLDICGKIQFESVSLLYPPSVRALCDVSFTIEAGSKVGLVGRTGSGKSSVISLMANLYPVQKGVIYIDDSPILNYNRGDLRKAIKIVSQDVIIFKGTLRENLLCGKVLPDRYLLSLCDQLGLNQVLKDRFSLSLTLENGGSNLSAGQRQLVAIVRTMIADPRILIFDEATANIDDQLEQIIHRGAEILMKGRTTLFIAHRLKTIKKCDLIFLFSEGCLAEQGSYQQLVDRKGKFYELLVASGQLESPLREAQIGQYLT